MGSAEDAIGSLRTCRKFLNWSRTTALRLQVRSSRSRVRHLFGGPRGCGWSLTSIPAHHVVAEGLLPVTVVLPTRVRGLVLVAAFARAGPIPQPSAVPLEAVALPAIVLDADLNCLAALEAHDLVEVDRICARHAPARRTSTFDAASGTL